MTVIKPNMVRTCTSSRAFPMNRIRLLLFPGMALFVACHSQTAPSKSARAELEQWSGQQGGGDVPKTRLLRTAEEWNAFWRQVEGDRPRPLDASRELAVVMELGRKRTGGYSVEFVGTRVEEGQLVIQFRETAPEPGMMVTQALSSPWAIALVPRTDLPVVFENIGTRQPSRREK